MAKHFGYEQYIPDSHLENEFNIIIEETRIQKWLRDTFFIRAYPIHWFTNEEVRYEVKFMKEGKWTGTYQFNTCNSWEHALECALIEALVIILEYKELAVPGLSTILADCKP